MANAGSPRVQLNRRGAIGLLLAGSAWPIAGRLSSTVPVTPPARNPFDALKHFGDSPGPAARSATQVRIAPSDRWNGAAGSGFAQIPTDPVRKSAKPALRLLSPPHQVYLDGITIGVAAGANDRGDCLTNLGLQCVEIHCEGSVAVIPRPSLRRYQDANGIEREAFGWWAEMLHDGRHRAETPEGGVDVYFKAIPRDPAMQARVIGPYRFHPRAALHDVELVVAPSLPEVSGRRFRSLRAAAEHIQRENFQFARITLAERGLYDWQGLNGLCHTIGYTVIDAAVPATIGKANLPAGSQDYDRQATLRPRIEPICFRGRNLTLDFRNVFQLYHEKPDNRQHWLDGCTMTNSAPAGRGQLWRKGVRMIAQPVRDWPYFTEVSASNLLNAMTQSSLARCCDLRMGGWDIFTESLCVYGNRVTDWDTSLDWNIYRPALAVSYRDGYRAATLECTGFNQARVRVITAKLDGATVGTFTTGSGEATYFQGHAYSFAGVVEWLNSLPGWSARLLDDRYMAAANQAEGTIGPWGPVPVRAAPVTIFSYFDIHPDFYQKNDTGLRKENVIIMDNVGTDLVTQNLFFKGSGGCADFLAVNNRFTTKPHPAGSGRKFMHVSQLTNAQSHVVIAFNTMIGQDLVIRTDFPATQLDEYCLIADNGIKAIQWRGEHRGTPTIRGNFPPDPDQ